MTSMAEAQAGAGEMAAVLDAGLGVLSDDATVAFVKYLRVVLPLDGFVFWVRSDLLDAEAMRNLNQATPFDVAATPTVDARGVLHYSSERTQAEAETVTLNRVMFTTTAPVVPFNEVSPVVMFVGEYQGFRFGFAERGAYFSRAGLHHYVGRSLSPTARGQLVDDLDSLRAADLVVSSSLPLWLTMQASFAIYPSFLVPEDAPTPYAAVHVVPDSARAYQAAPFKDQESSLTMLVTERVRVTLYGVRNDEAQSFIDAVGQRSLFTESYGLANSPVVRDERRPQPDLALLPACKVIDFDVNYCQGRVDDVARRFITEAIPAINAEDPPCPS